jgi:hypothetical protein
MKEIMLAIISRERNERFLMLMTTLVVAIIIVRKEMIETLMVVDLFPSSKPLSAYLTNAFNILLVL